MTQTVFVIASDVNGYLAYLRQVGFTNVTTKATPDGRGYFVTFGAEVTE